MDRLAGLSDPAARERLLRAIDHRVAAALSTAKAVLDTAAYLREERAALKLPAPRVPHAGGAHD